ncbi:unnamed protein product, partial [Symbiodinium sp. CCMP2456]
MFGEWIYAKLPRSTEVKVPKGGSQWFSDVYLGKDTEADEVILWDANGVFKVRLALIVRRLRLSTSDKVVGKDGTRIDVEVMPRKENSAKKCDSSSRNEGNHDEGDDPTRNFDVCDEVQIEDCAQEQFDDALDENEKSEEENLFASTPLF